MNLEQYFRLITTVIFQKTITSLTKCFPFNEKFNYDNVFFYSPHIICKDGFKISFQINNGAYCSTENGYRQLGHTFDKIEFGYPSEEEELLAPYAECPDDICNTVGSIPLTVAQQIVDKHGGIDWDKTISVDVFNEFVYGKKN